MRHVETVTDSAAYDETVVDQAAYDEQVLVAASYDYTYPKSFPDVHFTGPDQVHQCGQYIIAHMLPNGEYSTYSTITVPAQYSTVRHDAVTHGA